MDFTEIFKAYYSLYRTEAEIPNAEDDEFLIAIPLANEAINRWEHYDKTFWHELFTPAADGDGETELASGEADYDLPSDFKQLGGYIKAKNAQGLTIRRWRYCEPEDAQRMGDSANYAFVTGNRRDGFVLHLNPAPADNLDGLTLDYWYYRQATKIGTETDIPEMSDPYFMVHRMLANRFRGSRNPYYGSAKTDAEDKLTTMQLENNSGTWADPWAVDDLSDSTWGA